MVLDGDSMPLDVGRERRLFDRYQKHAINQRYHGCAAHNCDRPPAWVEFHHQEPWSRGGADGREERDLVVPGPPPDGRPPRELRHATTPGRRRSGSAGGPRPPTNEPARRARSSSAGRLVGHGETRHALEPAVEADVLGTGVQRPPQRRVRGPRQRLVAVAPGGAEADPHRRPVGREVPRRRGAASAAGAGPGRPAAARRRRSARSAPATPAGPAPSARARRRRGRAGAPARSRRSRAVVGSPRDANPALPPKSAPGLSPRNPTTTRGRAARRRRSPANRPGSAAPPAAGPSWVIPSRRSTRPEATLRGSQVANTRCSPCSVKHSSRSRRAAAVASPRPQWSGCSP